VTGDEIQSLLDVNMYHPTAVLKKFLPELSKRKDVKSGIIFVSSVQEYVAMPAAAAYAASKAFVGYLARAVSVELENTDREQIDTQVLCPNFVDTGMLDGVPIPLASLQKASPSSVVAASLRQLGHTRLPGECPATSGTAMHEILNRNLRFIHNNSVMAVTKTLTYLFYDKKRPDQSKEKNA